MKAFILIFSLASSIASAQVSRKLEFNRVKITASWYDACEEARRNLTDAIRLHSNDGKFLLFSGSCEWDVLISKVTTNLEPGSYSLGTYCMYESGIRSNRDQYAYLSNENAQIYLDTNVSPKVTCKEKERSPVEIKARLFK